MAAVTTAATTDVATAATVDVVTAATTVVAMAVDVDSDPSATSAREFAECLLAADVADAATLVVTLVVILVAILAAQLLLTQTSTPLRSSPLLPKPTRNATAIRTVST